LPYIFSYENHYRHPEPLYKKVKIRAVERGQTLKQIVLTSLERELKAPQANRRGPLLVLGQSKAFA